MKILGIESSCDETAASVVQDGQHLLSNVVNSQIDIHQVYGGVVPEVAARSHLEVINPVVNQALKQANLTWGEIDAIAVTYAPGLLGSLLIGTLAGRTLAVIKNKPFYPVHHILAHVYANFVETTPPQFPFLALVVSGGHSQIMLFKSHTGYQIIGQTVDDAVGEAFDKVAKILGLPYPGGPAIAQASRLGNPLAYQFPKAKLQHAYDFSFSGLKTAVLRAVQKETGVDINFPSTSLSALLSDSQRHDFASSFQRVAIETLVDKLILASEEFQPASLVLAGGVAANQLLRQTLQDRLTLPLHFPPLEFCTDNAVMVASCAYYQAQHQPPADPFNLEVSPSLSL